MTQDPELRPPTAAVNAFGAALIGLGIIVNLLARTLDGFVSGLLLGAGVMLVVLGVFTVVAAFRRQTREGVEPDEQCGTWLPSRDGDR